MTQLMQEPKIKATQADLEEQLRQATEAWYEAERQFDRTRLPKARENGKLVLAYKKYLKENPGRGKFGPKCEAIGLKPSERALWCRITTGWKNLERIAAAQGRDVEEIGVKEAGQLLSRYNRASKALKEEKKKIQDVPIQEVLKLMERKSDPEPEEEEEQGEETQAEKPQRPSVKAVLTSLTPTEAHWVLSLELEGLLPIPEGMTPEQFYARLDSKDLSFAVRVGLNEGETELCRVEQAQVTNVRIGNKEADADKPSKGRYANSKVGTIWRIYDELREGGNPAPTPEDVYNVLQTTKWTTNRDRDLAYIRENTERRAKSMEEKGPASPAPEQ